MIKKEELSALDKTSRIPILDSKIQIDLNRWEKLMLTAIKEMITVILGNLNSKTMLLEMK